MQPQIKPLLYQSWQLLPKKQKQKLIQSATQQQSDRRPNPQGQHIFEQINFIQHSVVQKNKPIKLTTYRQIPKNGKQIIAVVIMLHGLNSHLGHGAHIAHELAENGIITVGFDHRGFGRSEGEPGYAESLDRHVEDSLIFIGKIKQLYSNLPFFCLGLSMGGMTTYYLTLKHKHLFHGAIMMAPALKNMVGGFLVGLTKTLASILPKGMKLMKPIYGKASRNPTITQFVKNDQHYFSQRARLSTLQMLVTTMQKTPQTFIHYQCPFMIIQGGLDKLVNPDGAFQLYYQAKTKEEDKEILFYEKMWHDVWHEEEIAEINKKVVQWIKKRVEKSKNNQGFKQ